MGWQQPWQNMTAVASNQRYCAAGAKCVRVLLYGAAYA